MVAAVTVVPVAAPAMAVAVILVLAVPGLGVLVFVIATALPLAVVAGPTFFVVVVLVAAFAAVAVPLPESSIPGGAGGHVGKLATPALPFALRVLLLLLRPRLVLLRLAGRRTIQYLNKKMNAHTPY